MLEFRTWLCHVHFNFRGVPMHWIWKLVSINKRNNICLLTSSPFDSSLQNTLILSAWQVVYIEMEKTTYHEWCTMYHHPTGRFPPVCPPLHDALLRDHGHPRLGRAGRPDGRGRYSARVLASKLQRQKSTCVSGLKWIAYLRPVRLPRPLPAPAVAVLPCSVKTKRRFKERKTRLTSLDIEMSLHLAGHDTPI